MSMDFLNIIESVILFSITFISEKKKQFNNYDELLKRFCKLLPSTKQISILGEKKLEVADLLVIQGINNLGESNVKICC